MRPKMEFLPDQPKESSDHRSSSHPGNTQKLEQYRKQIKKYEALANYQKEIEQKQKGEPDTSQDCSQKKDHSDVYSPSTFRELQIEVKKMREMNRYLCIVSNRGPVEYQLTPDQKLVRKSGAGGLSTALASIGKELPPNIVRDIYSGISGNDIIGFQTHKDAMNFLQGAKDYLPDTKGSLAKT
jgi:hypothetical protein